MEYLIENWLVFLSIVIALLGGVPGIITTIKHFNNKPKFHFDIANIITGQFSETNDSVIESFVMLGATVANDGPQPLSPKRFDLSVNVRGHWVLLSNILIPEKQLFNSDTQNINLTNPCKTDLQRFSGSISRGQPLHGFLMFTSTDLALVDLKATLTNASKVKLSCVDIYNKKHSVVITLELNDLTSPTAYPKHGVTVEPK